MNSESIVNIRYVTDFPTCNFACTYCIAGHGEVTKGRMRHWNPERYLEILRNMAQLPFKVNVRFGVAGEFFLDKTLVNGAAELSHQPNVKSINLITNLSFRLHQYRRLLTPFDQSKVAIVASYHPTEIDDPVEWINTAEALSKIYDFSVVLVGFPPLIDSLESTASELRSRNIEVFVQPFIGLWEGLNYPRDYSEKQRNLLKSQMYSRHDYEFLLNLKKPGLCNAGHTSLYVNPVGKIYPCGMGIYDTELGDLTISPEVTLAEQPMLCNFDKCQCDTENMNTVVFANHYKFDAINQHKYHYRLKEESKARAKLSEWEIEY